MGSPIRRRLHLAALLLGTAAALAATTAALTGLPTDLTDLGASPAPAEAEDGPASVDLAGLDLQPRGRHAASVQVALEAPTRVPGLTVQVQARNAAGLVATADQGPVTVPEDGRWERRLLVTAPGLVEEMGSVRVVVGDGEAIATLP